ncbi:unnamed protein product [Linum tenue]|uniref:Uncharacterized protein n=1 Tax=Linum tenue TaxID=586396 RepID=A0AAV0JI15_9ROSI|nr:unnamed protein product [Linum tenue]
MSRLRPKLVFSGFTKAESEKMEKLLDDSVQPLNTKFFKNLARGFNQSSGRAGKPVVKWTEVESWFRKRQQGITPPLCSETGASKDGSMLPGPSPANESNGTSKKDTGAPFLKLFGLGYITLPSLVSVCNVLQPFVDLEAMK